MSKEPANPSRSPLTVPTAAGEIPLSALRTYRNGQVIDLSIDLATFDPATAISISAAAALMMGRGRRGVHEAVARRWVNKGQKPQGDGGPILKLPAVRVCGNLWTMPSWVDLFEKVRVRFSIASKNAAR